MSVAVREILKMAETRLGEAGVENPKLDAELLYMDLFSLDRLGLFKEWSRELPDELSEAYFGLIDRRAQREPLQYITGKQAFMGFDFSVSPDVLIPRPETETLAEMAINEINARKGGVSVLDLCCGSGCIGISVALLCKKADVVCSDISERALELAKANAKALKAKLSFARGDMFEAFKKRIANKRFDVIICNPPYIESAEIDILQPEVRDHEPRLALDGGEDGLDFYRRLLNESPAHLKKGGALFSEIGANQGEALRLLSDGRAEIFKDAAGRDRVAVIRF